MANWKYTFDLKDLWEKDWTDSNVHELGKAIAQRWRNNKAFTVRFADDLEIEEIIDYMDNICSPEEYQSILSEEGSEGFPTPIQEFDCVLSSLYDWADYNKVWVKTTI